MSTYSKTSELFNQEKSREFSEFLKEFLMIFTECIPHSVFDESFIVFDHLVNHLAGELTEELIKVCVVPKTF